MCGVQKISYLVLPCWIVVIAVLGVVTFFFSFIIKVIGTSRLAAQTPCLSLRVYKPEPWRFILWRAICHHLHRFLQTTPWLVEDPPHLRYPYSFN